MTIKLEANKTAQKNVFEKITALLDIMYPLTPKIATMVTTNIYSKVIQSKHNLKTLTPSNEIIL